MDENAIWCSAYQNAAERLFPGKEILSLEEDEQVIEAANAEYEATLDNEG